jgi:single-strand DNA-binding protein
MNVNQVNLAGNLTRDPELKYLPSETAVCEFGLAVNRKYRTAGGEDREDVLFIDCACFGKRGEVINQHFGKGKPIYLSGRLKFDQWEDKVSNTKRSKISVVVDDFQFVGGRDEQQGPRDDGDQRPQQRRPVQGQTQQRQPARAGASSRPRREEESPFSEEQQFKSDDIPFMWEGRHQQTI